MIANVWQRMAKYFKFIRKMICSKISNIDIYLQLCYRSCKGTRKHSLSSASRLVNLSLHENSNVPHRQLYLKIQNLPQLSDNINISKVKNHSFCSALRLFYLKSLNENSNLPHCQLYLKIQNLPKTV